MRTKLATTFAVAPVEPASRPLPDAHFAPFLRTYLGNVHSCSDYHARVVRDATANALVETVYLAFSQHRPLVLSPDAIWVTLAKGLAAHINMNPERYRKRFVQHEGKLTLEVRRNDLLLNSLETPWDEAVKDFSRQIREHVGPTMHHFIAGSFSTTGPTEQVASEVVLMDAVRSYFDYLCVCICGIPQITLEGTTQDWADIRARFDRFREFDLGWWVDSLAPVLEQFEAASCGQVDLDFWRNIYQEHPSDRESYGGPYATFTGWIGKFVPYLADVQRNPLLDPTRRFADNEHGLYLCALPSCIARAPVLFENAQGSRELEFLGGVMAIEQEPQTLALRPKVAWAVRSARDGESSW